MKKKLRNKLAGRVLAKKITPAEARRALAAAGIPVKGQMAAAAAAKSATAPPTTTAGTGVVFKSYGRAPAAEPPSLTEVYAGHSDPQLREGFNAAYAQRRTS
jgi:hypothetical protein